MNEQKDNNKENFDSKGALAESEEIAKKDESFENAKEEQIDHAQSQQNIGIRLPKIGEPIFYFPKGEQIEGLNGAEVLPGTVVQTWGNDLINLSAIVPCGPDVKKTSVHHRKYVLSENSPCWDYSI